ncbi:MAG: hypothetical protein IJS52_10635 [Bacilli bacterium]|nr:hypothetical protein [Bacilli bacterium]
MQRLENQMSNERPNHVLVTNMYVDIHENIVEEDVLDPQSGTLRHQFRYDVKRYSHEEYNQLKAEEDVELRGAVLELIDIVLSGGAQ